MYVCMYVCMYVFVLHICTCSHLYFVSCTCLGMSAFASPRRVGRGDGEAGKAKANTIAGSNYEKLFGVEMIAKH